MLAEGVGVNQGCKEVGILPRTFFKILARSPEGSDRQIYYARARAARADARSSELDDFVRRTCLRKDDPEWLDPNAARVAIWATQWQMGKENQRRFGEKVTIETNNKPAASREDHLKIVQESGIDIAAILECYATPTKEIAQGDEVTEVTDY